MRTSKQLFLTFGFKCFSIFQRCQAQLIDEMREFCKKEALIFLEISIKVWYEIFLSGILKLFSVVREFNFEVSAFIFAEFKYLRCSNNLHKTYLV